MAEDIPLVVNVPLPVNPPPVQEIDQIDQILEWIGFTDLAHRGRIIEDAFTTYADVQAMNKKDVTELSASFSRRTTTNGKIDFGIRRTKKLMQLLHWVQDAARTSYAPSITGYTQASLLRAFSIAGERADVRKQLRDKSDVKAKEASPGALVSENKWTDWEPKFINYLSTMIGMNGIPLSYVIRDNDSPDRTSTFPDFSEECIACAPLTGVGFQADDKTVHQSIVAFTTGQTSEDWISPVLKKKSGRQSMLALRNHFSGEGNVTRRIAEADRFKETLHYKNERSLTFETFLTKCQKMYNIYAKHGEVMTEDAKIRFLFKKIQHSGLESAVEAMKAKITTEPSGTVTYTTVANHISTAVSELPDYLSRNHKVSGVSGHTTNNQTAANIYNADGTINTGHHADWMAMGADNRKKVNDERARLGLGKNKGKNNNSNRSPRTNANTKNQISQLQASNLAFKKTISSLKRANGAKTDEEHEDIEDAGNSFGGKSKKKKDKH